MKKTFVILVLTITVLNCNFKANTQNITVKDLICDLGERPQIASTLKLKEGMKAPDFTLPSITGEKVTLSSFLGKKNVVISFIPAAWTSVCSAQWPRYGGLHEALTAYDAVLLGISVDNEPTLGAWIETIGNIWFTVLSDFWPHGEVSAKYGVLRSDGMAERAVFVIDKNGIIQYVRVHKITEMPEPSEIVAVLERINKK